MSKSAYKEFKENVKEITRYYYLLVAQTKNKRLVGSTNEWVLDNYYIISEQEKEMKEDLCGKGFLAIAPARQKQLRGLLQDFLEHAGFQVDKEALYQYVEKWQENHDDYLPYAEICAVTVMVKFLLIGELSKLCGRLESTMQTSGYEMPSTVEEVNVAAKENLLMMNIFNSLRNITRIKMAEVFDRISFSERMLHSEKAGMYDKMCDQTKTDYRNRIIRNVKKLHKSGRNVEYDYVKALVATADAEGRHVGWSLFPPKQWKLRSHLYIWITLACTLALSCIFAALAHTWWSFILMLIPVSQLVIDLFNQLLYSIHRPVNTFKLKFEETIPDEYATMVIIPTIVKNPAKVEAMLDQLEVYYLSNRRNETDEDNIFYTLVGDASAEKTEDMPWDGEVAEAGLAKVKELNSKYGREIFNFVYRRRRWSEGENCFLGYERKRGAILHFNDLLLGNLTEEQKEKYFRCETISSWNGKPITFIITLDTDTELVLFTAQELIGAMAHPLNRAVLAPDKRNVIAGYGIMQPRVNVDVEVTNKSRYAQLFSGLGGLDVYTTASFELYQDIFNEGSFCGKGIYDLNVFQTVLREAFPENLILSHDLIEGCHIRCGLINDVEVFDDSPSNYLDDAKRHHRWTRGDWQIISWLGRKVRNARGETVDNKVNAIGKWKIFDNLRRSLLSLGLVVLLFFGFTFGRISPVWYVVTALVVVALPVVFFLLAQIRSLHRFNIHYKYYMTLLRGIAVVCYKSLLNFALLPKEAYMYTDAIVRSLYRMNVSHRNLLNWVPSDEAAKSTRNTLPSYLKNFRVNYITSAVFAFLVWLFHFSGEGSTAFRLSTLISAAVVVLIWCCAPFLMYWLGKSFPKEVRRLKKREKEEVRKWAEDTWHFFDTQISADTNWLIPDNYQLNREEKADYKTSPTNIGFSMMAIVSAVGLKLITPEAALSRLGHIIDTVVRLEKWNGHLFNWYHVRTLEALPNFFISAADSGNFVACLFTLQGFLEELLSSGDLDDKHCSDCSDLLSKVERLIDHTDFSKLYNHELDVFSIGFDYGGNTLLPYHYNNFASEARLTSFMTIAKGDAPYKHWFCLDKTLVQYKHYKGVASWYGTMFEYFMPLIFLPTYRHTLMDETYSFAILAQKEFIGQINRQSGSHLPWGISETAYHELDDAQNYKYHAFGVPYLKFQNTTPDRIVISPYSSLMAISIKDKDVYDNMQLFKKLGMYDEFGFFESYDEEDSECVRAHYAHHQGMILASLANYLCDNLLQRYFCREPRMRAMDTLLKEKVQLKPYIDLKVTKYKRYQYSKTSQESDAREFDHIGKIPEVGMLSNGSFSVLVNDRGSGFCRYKDIQINRYRKIGSEYYGEYLYVRNMATDKVWSNTYAPLEVVPGLFRVVFASDRIKFMREDDGIITNTEITVVKDRNAELRKYIFENTTPSDVDLELTSYAEVILSTKEQDESHRTFNGMSIHSDFDHDTESLVFSKPVRRDRDSKHYAIHKLWVEDPFYREVQYETSRLVFLGRGNSNQHADVIVQRRTLSGTVGTTLDPIMSMRRRIRVPAGGTAVAFQLTGFGKSREQVLRMAEQYHDASTVGNAFDMATVFSNMRTSLSLLKGSQMYLYNAIAKYMLQTARLGKERICFLKQNKLAQSGLWRFGVSGDLAILLLEIDSLDRSNYAKEILQAYEYFKSHGMRLDVVFINDEKGGNKELLSKYIHDLASLEHLTFVKNPVGKVFILDGEDMSEDERNLFRVVARIAFKTSIGLSLEQQIAALEAADLHYQDKEKYGVLTADKATDEQIAADEANLAFFNRYGGFDKDGSEYVVTDTNTPMPWVNVLSNPRFGAIVSSSMSGFTFAHNAQQFKITSWTNDIVRDSASEMLLIGRKQFVPTRARHGQGYSEFKADYKDFTIRVMVFVDRDTMDKFYRMTIESHSDELQTINLNMVYKLVLGDNEEKTARFIYSEWDAESNSLYVRNMYSEHYSGCKVILSCTEPIAEAKINYPNRKMLSVNLDLPASGTRELAFSVSCRDEGEQAPGWTLGDIDNSLEKVKAFWKERLSVINVETPDPSFDYMVNNWYLYQVWSSRLYARAGFYQVGGATGFRDQLQDVMSVLYTDPAYARKQILDHASHQFPEGDVLHWWHEQMHLGARTTFSDDFLWLIFVTVQYINVTGDKSILDEMVPFCKGEKLGPGVAEMGIHYEIDTQNRAYLYEHLRLCVKYSLSRIGIHGLPLMGCGDWNDGMSRVGVGGKGESVWVGFFLMDLLPKMASLAEMKDDEEFASFCLDARETMRVALQKNAWDGAWFIRAYFDNGDIMGSRNSLECQIDLITQAWSILTDVADPSQKESIFRETDTLLVDREHEIIKLLTPPFKRSKDDPGYIMDYPKGVRENGGQYTHGAMWYIMALLKEGRYDQAYFLYSLINPIHRTSTLADVLKYKVEPYCIAADIYSNKQHAGRGGWTWYTGSASWAYKTAVENILGFHKRGNVLIMDPKIPASWNGFKVTYRFGSSTYIINCKRGDEKSAKLTVNLVDDGKTHEINFVI